jgi:hypothetical protein
MRTLGTCCCRNLPADMRNAFILTNWLYWRRGDIVPAYLGPTEDISEIFNKDQDIGWLLNESLTAEREQVRKNDNMSFRHLGTLLLQKLAIQMGRRGSDRTGSFRTFLQTLDSIFLSTYAKEMITKMTVFWDAAPCSLVEVYRRFRGACCFHHEY